MQKVAVVTGSAKGLGKEIALSLAKQNFTIVVHYHKSLKEARDVLARIKKNSPKSISACANLRDEDDVKKTFSKIFSRFGRVDLLINNVGNFLYKRLNETKTEEFKDVIETNVYSTFFCSRAVLPAMRKARSGQIVNIGAVGVGTISVTEKSAVYFMSKNALYYLTKAMAYEEAKNGLRINMISPASLVTDIFRPNDFPMGREASYSDVIKALSFLISDDAYYINGANIEVAGAFIPGMK